MITLAESVKRHLHEMFVQIADEIATGEISLSLSQDEAAGVPMALFAAEEALRSAFEVFTGESKEAEDGSNT